MLSIRKATPGDAEALHELYFQHLTDHPAQEAQDLDKWREKLTRFQQNSLYHVLVGEMEGKVVSSVTLVIVENLTHNLRPYALIENVVTHADFRGRGYAGALMEKAKQTAKEYGCYKVMLLTGSKRDSTLRFYENRSFNREDKTAFIYWIE